MRARLHCEERWSGKSRAAGERSAVGDEKKLAIAVTEIWDSESDAKGVMFNLVREVALADVAV